MRVTENLNSGLKREFAISVDAAEIVEKIEQRLESVSKTVRLPGFRAGKVPVKVIRQRYSDSIKGEVLEELINETSNTLLKERNLHPALQPKVQLQTFEEGKDFEYTLAFEVFPEIEEPDFSSIAIEKLKIALTEEDKAEALARLSHAYRKFVKPETAEAAKKGDVLVIDFEGKIDGVPFDGGKAEDFRLELGGGQLIDGFEDQLVGSTEGQKLSINVTFPENYGAKNLAGKPAVFDITVKQILVPQDPEMNDEFAKNFGVETLADLKENIVKQLEKDAEELIFTRTKKELFDQLEKICSYPVPEGMVEQEFSTLWEKVEQEKAADPEFSAKNDEELRVEYRAMSERRVKLGLLLAEIGRKRNVTVNQEELRQAIYDQARQFPGQEHKIIEFYRKNPGSLEQLKGPILEDKVVKSILDQVKTTEKSATVKELQKEFAA